MTSPFVLPSTQVTLGPDTYTIRSLDGVACYRLFTKLFNAAGVALKEAGGLEGESLKVGVIGALMANLSPALAEECRVVFAACSCVHRDGKEPELRNIFESHFARRPLAMMRWLVACAEYNFADFLEGDFVETLLSKLPGHPSSTPKSPTESSGSPSDS